MRQLVDLPSGRGMKEKSFEGGKKKGSPVSMSMDVLKSLNSKRPGSGVSDSVSGYVKESGEPIQLSEGEYVIRAPVVAFLGKGSNEAGAKLLDQFQELVMEEIKNGGFEAQSEQEDELRFSPEMLG